MVVQAHAAAIIVIFLPVFSITTQMHLNTPSITTEVTMWSIASVMPMENFQGKDWWCTLVLRKRRLCRNSTTSLEEILLKNSSTFVAAWGTSLATTIKLVTIRISANLAWPTLTKIPTASGINSNTKKCTTLGGNYKYSTESCQEIAAAPCFQHSSGGKVILWLEIQGFLLICSIFSLMAPRILPSATSTVAKSQEGKPLPLTSPICFLSNNFSTELSGSMSPCTPSAKLSSRN